MTFINIKHIAFIWLLFVMLGCGKAKKEYNSFNEYPIRSGSLTEMVYTPSETQFSVWAPTAEDVRVMLYKDGTEDNAYKTLVLEEGEDGTWIGSIQEDLKGRFYTFNVKVNGRWLGDTPGIMASAVGVNGRRAAIIDMNTTNSKEWERDVRPALANDAGIVLYELHHYDFSVDTASGIKNRAKYLALTENGTHNSAGMRTGIDHLKELGVTHIQLMPSFDFGSIDETSLNNNQYSWGYDVQNYNVPEGSYATNACKPEIRIREFKQMIQALHRAGIRVVMDIPYSYTANVYTSNFERTVPGYFYRQKEDGAFADASGCGNEIASERPMVRKFIVESILYWIREYHIDGICLHQMGILDVETVNEIRKVLADIDPSILIYGEGWSAEQPQLRKESLATKANMKRLPEVASFGDELRDALRGKWDDERKGAFLAGLLGNKECVKFGIVGAVKHPQVKCKGAVTWASQPFQMIGYVSGHDKYCLADGLKATVPECDTEDLIRLDKLAQTIVFTSQSIPLIYSGEEIMRTKRGVCNSDERSDNINSINWDKKVLHKDVFDYYKGLIALRKFHPAFRIGNADGVRKHLEFLPVGSDNIIAYRLKEHAGGDKWEDIIVVFNGGKLPSKMNIPDGNYTVVCKDGIINLGGIGKINGGEVMIPARSALIIYK